MGEEWIVISFKDEEGKHKLTRYQFKLLIQSAALLHDIVHGPFSHAFEEILNEEHEDWTNKIIMCSKTEVNKIFTSSDEEIDEIIPLKKEKNFLSG